jgi:hypothetical protein
MLLTVAAPAAALVALPAAAEPEQPDLCVPAIATIDATTPLGFGSCPGVRPGAMIRIPRPDLGDDTHVCTLNFFFMGTDSRGGTHAYMGTAGHCILGEGGLSRDVVGRPGRWARGLRSSMRSATGSASSPTPSWRQAGTSPSSGSTRVSR